MSDVVYLEIGRRRKVHRAIQANGQLLTDERCNIDSALGERRVVLSAPGDRLCRRCFPSGQA